LNQVEEFQRSWRFGANSRSWLKSEPGSKLRRRRGTLGRRATDQSVQVIRIVRLPDLQRSVDIAPIGGDDVHRHRYLIAKQRPERP
jgi:hypothetical protein